MAKPYIPKVTVTIKREFDGKTEGARVWTMTGHGGDVDKFEDALTYLCNAAMDHMPDPPPTLRSVQSNEVQS